MKMTAIKLKAMKRRADMIKDQWFKLDQRITALCTHPRSLIKTFTHYTTDTLGTNGVETTYKQCTICGKYIE